jgi:uncharacterized protein (DUF736 family)
MDKEKEIGSLWEHENAKGTYLTGDVNGVQVVIFPNRNAKNDRAPKWRVFKSRPRDGAPPDRTPNEDEIPF